MIETLPNHRAALAHDALSWCDAFWDERRGLPWAPPGSGFGDVHVVQQCGWYAYGLLLRGGAGDVERAQRCLAAVLALQYDEPGEPWHGTFARFAEFPHPPGDAVMWVHFDPNWRQFLGSTFLILLSDFENALEPALVRRLERAIRLAVEGEPEGRVPANYANVALMHAFLLVEAEIRFDELGWVVRGETLARDIVAGYERFGAFEEYNSPTYYGIDFHALALWSQRSGSASLRQFGATLEAALWRDVARWYHAGLRNFCGPHSRSYGMDMTRYVAQLGLDIASVVGSEHAPLPEFTRDVDHGHDLFLAPVTAALGRRVPDDAVAALTEFPGEHVVEQRIDDDPSRVASGWLGETLMIGAERHESDRLANWEQYVPATVHWRMPDGEVGWIAMRTNGAPRARASQRLLEVQCGADDEIRLRISHGAIGRFSESRWDLFGLSVELGGSRPAWQFQTDEDGGTLVFTPRASGTVSLRFDVAS